MGLFRYEQHFVQEGYLQRSYVRRSIDAKMLMALVFAMEISVWAATAAAAQLAALLMRMGIAQWRNLSNSLFIDVTQREVQQVSGFKILLLIS